MVALEVEAQGSAILTIVYPSDIMLCKVKPKYFITHDNTIDHLEYVRGTLVGTYPKISKKLIRSLLIGILNIPYTNTTKGMILVASVLLTSSSSS